jgi:hypothetical protein
MWYRRSSTPSDRLGRALVRTTVSSTSWHASTAEIVSKPVLRLKHARYHFADQRRVGHNPAHGRPRLISRLAQALEN